MNPHATAIQLVTCASTNDVDNARALLTDEDAEAVALSLAGLCWTTIEFAARRCNMAPEDLWEHFATTAGGQL